MQPTITTPMILNSLASESKVISEPMECNLTPVDSPSHTKSNNSSDVPMTDTSNNVEVQVITHLVIFDNFILFEMLTLSWSILEY